MRWGFMFAALFAVTPVYAGATAHAHLDGLFRELKSAQTPDDAKNIEKQILAGFRISGSASMDLLMQRADTAYGAGDDDAALKLMQAVTAIDPKYAEGWHVLGVLLQDKGDDKAAISALGKAIALNPRHFVAMAQLGALIVQYGDKDKALSLFRRALQLDPKFEGLQQRVDSLTRQVDGQGI